MKMLFALITISLIPSCTKESITIYYAYLKNTTMHKIEMKPYFSGVVRNDKVVTLLAGEVKQIADGSYRGIGNQAIFLSEYMTGADSLVVVFDDMFPIIHYGITPPSTAPKYYLFTSNRNVGNSKNYKLETRDLNKHKRENTFTFYFIEQDYLDAR